ncbi:MAG: hypothetical protein ABIL89_04965 [candidate division WOR-3 bacterium]
MINFLFSLMESPIIRYSLYEQIYDKFYKTNDKFLISVSNYIAGINFGSLYYNIRGDIGIYLNYLNSGKMYKTDEAGNIIGEFYSNFINFSFYKKFLKLNVHYENYIENENNLNLSIGAIYKRKIKEFEITFMFDYLGINTPLIFGINTNYKGFNVGFSYELEYKFIYNVCYKLPITNALNLYLSYTNRYEDFKTSKNIDILTGFLGGIEVKFKKYKIGYGIRALSDYGFINTIQVVYE